MNNFKKLKAWTLGRAIARKTYQVAMKLTNQEQYIFASQLARAAISIPSNVAEGNSRRSTKEFARFVEIALGSAFELETQMLIMQDLIVGEQKLISEVLADLEEEQKILYGLLRKLKTESNA